VLPGLLADDGSTWTLRRILRHLGYRVHGWRLGRNIGPTAATVSGLQNRLLDLRSRYDAAVSVIGWSLGGIYARTLARDTPSAVRQVITLGSPIRLAHEGQSRAGRAFNRYAHLHVVPRELPLEFGVGALPVPATSIYSRYDGIVAWQVCLDPPSAHAENIAVVGSHFGFGHHPAVIWAVADRLAQPLGRWAPFRAPARCGLYTRQRTHHTNGLPTPDGLLTPGPQRTTIAVPQVPPRSRCRARRDRSACAVHRSAEC
jgi:pimeloyl-ACP methyl ester carboxylesterase